MGWVEDIRGKVIGLDTAPIIYYVEKNAGYIEMLRPFFQLVHDKECLAVTSTVTWLEALVMPIRKNHGDLIGEYRELFFNVEGLITFDTSPSIAEIGAQLRAKYAALRAMDAIQIATAISAGASAFLTNDIKLASISDIKVLVLDKLKTDS